MVGWYRWSTDVIRVFACDRLTIRRNQKYGHVVDIVVFASGDRKKGSEERGERSLTKPYTAILTVAIDTAIDRWW